MKHYDQVEWILYKKKLLDNRIYEEMENHLYQCDQCLDIFLSLIDDLEIEETEDLIPIDFTNKVVNSIKNISPIKKNSIKKKRKLPDNFFIYYTAVASVAIILTGVGFFGRLVDNVPRITEFINIEGKTNRSNSLYKLSESITEKTSIFINDFQISRNKEDK